MNLKPKGSHFKENVSNMQGNFSNKGHEVFCISRLSRKSTVMLKAVKQFAADSLQKELIVHFAQRALKG